MSKVEVLNWKKEKVGSVDLPEDVFGQTVNADIMAEVVRWQLACRRQGTHSTKTRAFVSGGGKKPFKQKGTGNARQGSSRSPLMPGGAILFGPQPRDYSYTLPKKVKKAGLRSALSYLLAEGRLFVLDGLESKDGKSGELSKRLKSFGLEKAVLVDAAEKPLVKRASRNLKGYRYLSVQGVNVYDLLKYDNAILSKESLEDLVSRCRTAGSPS